MTVKETVEVWQGLLKSLTPWAILSYDEIVKRYERPERFSDERLLEQGPAIITNGRELYKRASYLEHGLHGAYETSRPSKDFMRLRTIKDDINLVSKLAEDVRIITDCIEHRYGMLRDIEDEQLSNVFYLSIDTDESTEREGDL